MSFSEYFKNVYHSLERWTLSIVVCISFGIDIEYKFLANTMGFQPFLDMKWFCEGGLKVDYVRWLAARRDSVLAPSSNAREIARVNGLLSTES